MLETGFAHIAQALLWPVLILVALGFVYALCSAGATLMEALQRRQPGYRVLQVAEGASLEALELQIVRQLEPARLLGRVAPLLGLIATMVPLHEMMRITEIWVDTAMQLGEKSLRTMDRLVRAQARRNGDPA